MGLVATEEGGKSDRRKERREEKGRECERGEGKNIKGRSKKNSKEEEDASD